MRILTLKFLKIVMSVLGSFLFYMNFKTKLSNSMNNTVGIVTELPRFYRLFWGK